MRNKSNQFYFQKKKWLETNLSLTLLFFQFSNFWMFWFCHSMLWPRFPPPPHTRFAFEKSEDVTKSNPRWDAVIMEPRWWDIRLWFASDVCLAKQHQFYFQKKKMARNQFVFRPHIFFSNSQNFEYFLFRHSVFRVAKGICISLTYPSHTHTFCAWKKWKCNKSQPLSVTPHNYGTLNEMCAYDFHLTFLLTFEVVFRWVFSS